MQHALALDDPGKWWVSLKVDGHLVDGCLDAPTMPVPIRSALSALRVADIDLKHHLNAAIFTAVHHSAAVGRFRNAAAQSCSVPTTCAVISEQVLSRYKSGRSGPFEAAPTDSRASGRLPLKRQLLRFRNLCRRHR